MRWQIVARALDAQAYGNPYAFIALERIGGVVVYDISDPHAPFFVDYSNFRNFSTAVNSAAVGDLGPEGLVFIKEEESQMAGRCWWSAMKSAARPGCIRSTRVIEPPTSFR